MVVKEMDMDTAQKAAFYVFVKDYLEGAMKPQMSSEFGRGYKQGLASLKSLLERMEQSVEKTA